MGGPRPQHCGRRLACGCRVRLLLPSPRKGGGERTPPGAPACRCQFGPPSAGRSGCPGKAGSSLPACRGAGDPRGPGEPPSSPPRRLGLSTGAPPPDPRLAAGAAPERQRHRGPRTRVGGGRGMHPPGGGPEPSDVPTPRPPLPIGCLAPVWVTRSVRVRRCGSAALSLAAPWSTWESAPRGSRVPGTTLNKQTEKKKKPTHPSSRSPEREGKSGLESPSPGAGAAAALARPPPAACGLSPCRLLSQWPLQPLSS